MISHRNLFKYIILILLFSFSILKADYHGRILDSESKEPLIGAAISIKGTEIGAIADKNGSFSIQYNKDNIVLVVNYVGYQSKEVIVSNGTLFPYTTLSDLAAPPRPRRASRRPGRGGAARSESVV